MQDFAGSPALQQHAVVILRRYQVESVDGQDAAFLHHRRVGVVKEEARSVPDEGRPRVASQTGASEVPSLLCPQCVSLQQATDRGWPRRVWWKEREVSDVCSSSDSLFWDSLSVFFWNNAVYFYDRCGAFTVHFTVDGMITLKYRTLF